MSIWSTCWESVRTEGTKGEILLEIAWHVFHVQSCLLEKSHLKYAILDDYAFPFLSSWLLPWFGSSSWKWQPTPVLLPGKSHGQKSLVAIVHGITKSWTWLSNWAQHSSIYSLWLRNPSALESSGLRGMSPYKFLYRRYGMDIGSCDTINLSGWFWCSFRGDMHSLKGFQLDGTSFPMRVFKRTDLT